MWPYLTYNKFTVEEPMEAPIERFRHLDFEKSRGRWEAQTVGGNPLGNISIDVGDKVRRGTLEAPSTVEVPAGTVVKRGSGFIIAKTFEVIVPFQAPVVRVTNTYFVLTDPDEPSVSVLVPNHLLNSSPGR